MFIKLTRPGENFSTWINVDHIALFEPVATDTNRSWLQFKDGSCGKFDESPDQIVDQIIQLIRGTRRLP